MVRVLSANSEGIAAAVKALRNGALVGLPTETVYGLAADAENAQAVARIYLAKGRPSDHPLIVHIADAQAAQDWATNVPAYAVALMQQLWPGPLTVVLPRSQRAGDFVTGGQDTVALRSPAHPVAAAVIREFGGGIAAPSANRFGRVSPTTAAHVVAELGDVLTDNDLVLDGGPCTVGLESTIVDCTAAMPRILRPGAIGPRRLSLITGLPVAEFDARTHSSGPRVSGSLDSHYAPSARVTLCQAHELSSLITQLAGPIGLMAMSSIATPQGLTRLLSADTPQEYALGLYAALRAADDLELQSVIAVPPQDSDDEVVSAIIDRLTRAAF